MPACQRIYHNPFEVAWVPHRAPRTALSSLCSACGRGCHQEADVTSAKVTPSMALFPAASPRRRLCKTILHPRDEMCTVKKRGKHTLSGPGPSDLQIQEPVSLKRPPHIATATMRKARTHPRHHSQSRPTLPRLSPRRRPPPNLPSSVAPRAARRLTCPAPAPRRCHPARAGFLCAM